VRQDIPPETSDDLRIISREEQASLFMTLLAAFTVLLHGCTNQDDIVVGTDESGRNHRVLEGMIGFFINHLVLRTNVSGNPTFRELVRRVKETCLAAFAHQDLPFDKLVELVRPIREAGYSPLFQVLFVMNTPTSPMEFESDMRASSVGGGQISSKYDLSLFVTDRPAGISTAWVYRTDLFDATTIRSMISDFDAIIRNAASAPDTTVAELRSLVNTKEGAIATTARDERRAANRARLQRRSG